MILSRLFFYRLMRIQSMADSSKWVSVDNPFQAQETDTHIIGRGANDCKAGVALMLFIAFLIHQKEITGDNLCLLFSFQEEGNGEKTSIEIGQSLGKNIPVSSVKNTLLCLENTVSVSPESFLITLYDREPCNVFIEVQDTLKGLKEFTIMHPLWKPVYISPLQDGHSTKLLHHIVEPAGHSATISNDNNEIYKALQMRAEEKMALVSGDLTQTSVITNDVKIYEMQEDIEHKAIFNFRGIKSLKENRGNA